MGGIGDLGECVQAPLARRFAPNPCSVFAPPGACSQAIFTTTSLLLLLDPEWAIHILFEEGGGSQTSSKTKFLNTNTYIKYLVRQVGL